MHDEATIGARLRVLRRWRGMTLAQAAGLAGLSVSFLSMAERGQRTLDRRSHLAALAGALRVSETDIVGGPHLSSDPVQSEPHVSIPALRVALETNRLGDPMCERARPLPDLVAELQRIEPLRSAGDWVKVGELLPAVLDELHVHVADPADEAAAQRALAALVDAGTYASNMAKHLGYSDLASYAASRATEAAAALADPVHEGKAAFMRILTMPKDGSWDRALQSAHKAVDRLQPDASTPVGLQVLGMLTLTTAMAAAASKRWLLAEEWLRNAEELARRIPDDPSETWQHFSLTNVRVWELSIGVERGWTGGDITALADQVQEGKLRSAPVRRAAYLADVGRGLAREKQTRNQAVRWLRRAEKAAPQDIRNKATVRHTIEVLREQALADSIDVELRGMMARMGIPH